MIAADTIAAFDKYSVLSERELESRYEVWLEQYAVKANIEAETGQSIAQTMILPAAIRYVILAKEAGVDKLANEVSELVDELTFELDKLKEANDVPEGTEGLDLAVYARDNQLAALDGVRTVVDKLERTLPDDMWPLPKYSEVLFLR